MKKNNTDRLLTGGLGLMCIVNFLLYASVFLLLGTLPMAMPDRAIYIFPAFLAGEVLAGPFHAYLADTFRRKHVLLFALAGLALSMTLSSYVPGTTYEWMALIQGVCFALATGAGTTISIDITPSGHRTGSNMLFSLCGRLGMVIGWIGGAWSVFNSSLPLSHLASILNVAALLLASLVYVPFRAPIGLKLCSLDRFLLPVAWLPALNVCIGSYAFGLLGIYLVALFMGYGIVSMLPLLVIPILTPLMIKGFIKLSHHCQRATSNMTFNLWMDIGLLAGLWSMSFFNIQEEMFFSEGTLLFSTLIASVLLFMGATYPYYKKKRVR